LRGAEFGDGEGDGGEKLRMDANEIRSEANVEQRRVRGKLARVLFFVAMRGGEIAAVGRQSRVTSRSVPQQTGQMVSAFAGQKRPGLRFLTDRTGQEEP